MANNSVDLTLYNGMTKAQQIAFEVLLYGYAIIDDNTLDINDMPKELDFD